MLNAQVRLQLRLQGQEHRERQHAEDLSDAQGGNDQGLLRCPVPAIASNTNSLYTPRVKPWVICTCVVTLFMAQPANKPLTTSAIANEWLEAAELHEPGVEDAPLRTVRSWNARSAGPHNARHSRGPAEQAAEHAPRTRRAPACGHHTSESRPARADASRRMALSVHGTARQGRPVPGCQRSRTRLCFSAAHSSRHTTAAATRSRGGAAFALARSRMGRDAQERPRDPRNGFELSVRATRRARLGTPTTSAIG